MEAKDRGEVKYHKKPNEVLQGAQEMLDDGGENDRNSN